VLGYTKGEEVGSCVCIDELPTLCGGLIDNVGTEMHNRDPDVHLNKITFFGMFARARIWPCPLRKQSNWGSFRVVSRRGYAVSAADLRFGQPVHETHPHLLKAGEGEIWSSRSWGMPSYANLMLQ
jgi:hypothetical protein